MQMIAMRALGPEELPLGFIPARCAQYLELRIDEPVLTRCAIQGDKRLFAFTTPGIGPRGVDVVAPEEPTSAPVSMACATWVQTNPMPWRPCLGQSAVRVMLSPAIRAGAAAALELPVGRGL